MPVCKRRIQRYCVAFRMKGVRERSGAVLGGRMTAMEIKVGTKKSIVKPIIRPPREPLADRGLELIGISSDLEHLHERGLLHSFRRKTKEIRNSFGTSSPSWTNVRRTEEHGSPKQIADKIRIRGEVKN